MNMVLATKQLVRQMGKGKIFTSLLLILTMLTSLSFFFVIFGIDGNMSWLNSLDVLTENQELYRTALKANTNLAYMFLFSTIGLTAFVFVMFFYRFFRANKRQIGCLRSLGFRDSFLRLCLVIFVIGLSVIGVIFGLIGGYFLSDVLISGNMHNYQVVGLVKEVSLQSLIMGLVVPVLIFSVTAFFSYSFVKGKEPGALIAGSINQTDFGLALRVANAISGVIPAKNKFPYRIALQKPLAVILILAAVMTLSVFVILGASINLLEGFDVNNLSATINHVTGVIIGALLIFLALYINFDDNTRDMLILHMMGHKAKSIRKLLVDVYMPIVWATFVITLAPSIMLAGFIKSGIAIAVNKPMPFSTNPLVILALFLLINLIYWFVQSLFGMGIKRIIAKEDMMEFVYAE